MCRKRILRFCVLIGGVVTALLIVAVITEKWRGRNRLNRVLQQIESAGVTLDLEAAFERDVPDMENGAIGLSNLTELIHGYEMPVDFPPRAMLVDSPGFARSGIDGESWNDANGNTYRWNQLNDARRDIRRLMRGLSNSAAKPVFASPLDPSKGVVDMKLESLPIMPGVMRICIISCMLDLKDGNGTGAIQSVDTFLDFYCNKADDPIIIAQMIRWAQCRVSYGLTWELIQHVDADDQAWGQLQDSWSRCDFIGDCVSAWESELAGMNHSYSLLKASPTYRQHLLESYESIENDFGLAWDPPARGWLLHSAVVPAWNLLWADQDHAQALEESAINWNLMRMARTNVWEATMAEAGRLGRHVEPVATAAMAFSVPELSYYDRCRYLFHNVPTLILGSYVHRALRAQTEVNMAVTVVALKRHQIKYGDYPETLAKLVPDFLSEIPEDPFDHVPLRYRRIGTGDFVLYSIGSNGVDDGGSIESTTDESNAFDGGWSARDFVWPKRGEAR